MKFFSGGLLARFLSLLLVCSMVSVSFGSAANARFISPDTMDPAAPGVGTNRYSYSLNDPINKSDPNGHIVLLDDIAIGLGIACASGGCQALVGVAVGLGIWGGIDLADDGKVNFSPLAGTASNMAGKDGIYTGPGSLNDWGDKGAHWKGVDSKGRQHEVGIRPGAKGDFEFEPVGGAVPGKAFDEAIGSLQPTLGSTKGLEKLHDQVNAAQDHLKGSKGYADRKRELQELSDVIESKLSQNSTDKKSDSDSSDDKNSQDDKGPRK
ncbi:hypothetical protein ABK249_29360 [Neorhizobium sp. Rsf11]|uniref:Uncharacterized protein n=2 Tax=Neorhizobium TaxID=1525371 RepID=A0ABV0MBE8_9HYPH|nr:hypothetical protein [Neorhizobium petrolearium]MCC2613781.1 hypothetical protein [Neorhizobium petrolearium]WGI72091.1 hypothetical protein QEO92_28545 [Neorhizobium petrolearium]